MNVCVRPDYLDPIYDNKRRNRYPQSACATAQQYQLPAQAYCALSPSFLAQPFLTIDTSTAENGGELVERSSDSRDASATTGHREAADQALHRSQHLGCAGRCRSGPFTAVCRAADAAAGRVPGSSLSTPIDGRQSLQQSLPPHAVAEDELIPSAHDCALAAMRSGNAPWAATSSAVQDLYRVAGCEPCELALSCGDGMYGEGCRPVTAFKRRTALAGTCGEQGMPALQMPHMDRVAYADGTPCEPTPIMGGVPRPSISALDARGSNNPFLAEFSRLVHEYERQREVTQYGIGYPPFPKPCPPTPHGVAPRYDPVPPEAQSAPPILLDRAALRVSDNCGCNRSECAARGDNRGTTCARGTLHPQSIAGIYARQSK